MTKLDVYTTDLYQRYQACYTAHHVMVSSALGNKMHTGVVGFKQHQYDSHCRT